MIHHKKSEIHARLPKEHFTDLLIESSKKQVTLSELIRKIIAEYLAKNCWYSDTLPSLPFDPVDSNEGNINGQGDVENLRLNGGGDSLGRTTSLSSQITIQSYDDSMQFLKLLKTHLKGFDVDVETSCTGERSWFNWAFGLDASEESFESSEDCLIDFMKYLSQLSFNYKLTISNDKDTAQRECNDLETKQVSPKTPINCIPSGGSDFSISDDDFDSLEW